jgi:NitT/TauT family transport system substrate-binding protein
MRTPFRPTAVGAVCCLALVLAGCSRNQSGAPAGGGQPTRFHLVLQTDWYAEPEHGGFYEALAKGYYRDAGLDVEIRQGSPMTRPEQMIATGQADIAIGRSEYVLVDAGRGIPFVMLGAMMQHDPQAIMVHHESGIRSLRDLNGRSIMAVPGSPFIAIMEQVLHIQVGIIPSDFGMSRFLADPAFVQQCFITNEPYYVRQHGANVDVLPVSDCGFDPYRVWYARRDFLDRHPDVVRAFGVATVRGWREYMNGDSAPADAVIASLNLKMDPAFMAYSRKAMQSYRLVEGDPRAGDALGRIRRERLAAQIKQLGDIGLLDHPVAVEDVWDPRFSTENSSPAGTGN